MALMEPDVIFLALVDCSKFKKRYFDFSVPCDSSQICTLVNQQIKSEYFTGPDRVCDIERTGSKIFSY